MTSAREIGSLLEVSTELRGAEHRVRLRIPVVREVLPALPDLARAGTREEYRKILRLELLALVDKVDDHESTFAELDRILDSPSALRAVLEARNLAYASLREAGRFWFACPRCATEAAFDIGTYAVIGLRLSELPPMVTPTLPVVPHLSRPGPQGKRPAGVARSRPIRFELPAAVRGLDSPFAEGVMGDVHPGSPEVEAAWEHFAPPTPDPTPERTYWQRGNLGFEAILHLAVALQRLDGLDKVTPDVLEDMLVPDLYFLDAVYYLTHSVDIPENGALVAPCSSCHRIYLRAR